MVAGDGSRVGQGGTVNDIVNHISKYSTLVVFGYKKIQACLLYHIPKLPHRIYPRSQARGYLSSGKEHTFPSPVEQRKLLYTFHTAKDGSTPSTGVSQRFAQCLETSSKYDESISIIS